MFGSTYFEGLWDGRSHLGNDRPKGDQNLVPFKKLNPFIAIAFGLKRNIHFLSLQRYFLGVVFGGKKLGSVFFR